MRKFARVAAAGAGIFTIGYLLFSSQLLRRWLRKSPPRESPTPPEPATFFRPIKPGERSLARNLEIFLSGVETGDRILFAVPGAREQRVCTDLARQFSHLDIHCLVSSEKSAGTNPKIRKLVQLAPFATHDRWIVLDSDALADPAFLRAFRLEWQESGAAAFSAPYVFEKGGNLASRIDAAGTELALWPGVALLRATQGVDFLAGACMAVRGEVLRRIGGWEILADALADDHELGRAISRSGGEVAISECLVRLHAPPMRMRDWLLHQHRASVTFRLCNPAGCLGLPLTFGLTSSFLFALASPLSPRRWLLHLAVLASRQAAACALPGPCSSLLAIWLSGLVEPVFWLLAWLPLPVRWAGKWIFPRKPAPNPPSKNGSSQFSVDVYPAEAQRR